MRTLCGFVFIGFVASLSHGQSLADVAKKERQRREKLHDTKVYREDDLEAAGERISVIGIESSNEDRASRKKERADRERVKTDEWDQVFSTYRARYESTKAAKERYLDRYVNGIPAGAEGKRIPCQRILSRWHIPGWTQHAITCENLETKIQEQETLLREIQRQCLNEARKMSILPGRARLR